MCQAKRDRDGMTGRGDQDALADIAPDVARARDTAIV
jgi:hypothetical protein